MSDTEKKIIHLHKIIDTIRSINRVLNSGEEQELMIKKVCDVLVNIRGYYYSWILLFDEKKEMKSLEAAGPKEEIEEIKSWIRKGNLPETFSEVLTKNEVVIVNESTYKCPVKLDLNVWTLFITPIFVDNELEGVLCAAASNKDAHHAKEKVNLSDIANEIGYALARSRQKERIAEREQRYRTVFENTGAATCIIENDGTISLANEGFAELSGYPLVEILNNKNWKDFVHAEDLKRMMEQHDLRRVEKDRALRNYQFRFIDKDKNIKHINLYVDLIPGTDRSITSLIDVTMQVNAEEELKENQLILSSITNSAQDAIILINNLGNIVFWNPAAEKMFGYKKSEILGKNLHQLLTPEYLHEKFTVNFPNFKHSGEGALIGKTIVLEAKKSNGEIIPVEVSLASTKIENKWGATGIIRDISTRESLQRTNTMLSKAIESSPVSIVITDKEGNIEYVNPYFEEKTGYKKEEVLGKSPLLLLYDELSDSFFDEILAKLRIENRWHGEIKNKKKNGDLLWEQVDISPICNIQGEITQYVYIREDITNKKESLSELQQAKENAEHNEKRFKALHDASFGGIAIHDKGTILDCNQGLSNITGYSHEELVGMNGLLLLAEECRKEVLQKIIKGHHDPYEAYGLKKNGQKYPLRIEGKMIPYYNKIMRITEFRDITEQKKIEEELIRSKEKAEESDRLKSAFLANMSHEIRTPMNGILGFTDLLMEPNLSPENKQEFLEIIKASGDKMLNTLNDIIDVAKIEAGMVKLNKEEVNLSTFINSLYHFFLPETQKKNLKLIMNENNNNPLQDYNTDPVKLNSILTNLIKNAIKFTTKGYIEYGYTNTKDSITFYVTDTGIGIAEENQKNIFERFIQADVAMSRVYEGSGLGLSIAKSYTEMLGGTISLHSELKKGTTFFVKLPYQEKSPVINDNSQTNKEIEKASNNIKVLIAEDDPVSVELLKLFLKKVASEVIVTQNGVECLNLIKQNPEIDLILMDVKMPEMDGYSVAKKIREFNNNVKIITQTAFAQEDENKKAIDAGSNAFITKPINKRILIESIKTLFPEI